MDRLNHCLPYHLTAYLERIQPTSTNQTNKPTSQAKPSDPRGPKHTLEIYGNLIHPAADQHPEGHSGRRHPPVPRPSAGWSLDAGYPTVKMGVGLVYLGHLGMICWVYQNQLCWLCTCCWLVYGTVDGEMHKNSTIHIWRESISHSKTGKRCLLCILIYLYMVVGQQWSSPGSIVTNQEMARWTSQQLD